VIRREGVLVRLKKPRIDPMRFVASVDDEVGVAVRRYLSRPNPGDEKLAREALAGMRRTRKWRDGGLPAATSILARSVALGGDLEEAAEAIFTLQDNAAEGSVFASGFFACDAATLEQPGLVKSNADEYAHNVYALEVLIASGRGKDKRVSKALDTFRRLAANGSYCCRHCTHMTLRLWALLSDQNESPIRNGLGWLWGREMANGRIRSPVFMLDTLNRLPIEDARARTLSLLLQVIPQQGRDGSWGRVKKTEATAVVVRALDRAEGKT
jgi:hypothetical protein